jgi:hypothetical protein
MKVYVLMVGNQSYSEIAGIFSSIESLTAAIPRLMERWDRMEHEFFTPREVTIDELPEHDPLTA